MKPPLKWVGGKTQLLSELFDEHRLRGTYTSYHEPFVGGGSVLWSILARQSHESPDVRITDAFHASDANPALIGLYQCLQHNVEGLLQALRPLCTAYLNAPVATKEKGGARRSSKAVAATSLEAACEGTREDVYYWARSEFNSHLVDDEAAAMDQPAAAALCLFLNKTGFRGVYRTSKAGFNVPYGHYSNPAIYDDTHLRELSALIQPVTFRCEAFETAIERVTGEALVYVDPPYVPLKTTSFVGYTHQGFDAEATKQLFHACATMASLPDTRVVLSNSAAPVVCATLDTMPQFAYKTCDCRRAIHSKNPAAKAKEVIAWSVKKQTGVDSYDVPDKSATDTGGETVAL